MLSYNDVSSIVCFFELGVQMQSLCAVSAKEQTQDIDTYA